MITEKRTLPVGVEFDGRIHRELAVRPRLVKDLVAASSSDLVAQNKNNYEVCCLASQIVALGDIPPEEITGELVLEMLEDDFNVLAAAALEVQKSIATFRRKQDVDSKADGGATQDGIPAR